MSLALLAEFTVTPAFAQANLEINPFAGYRLGGSGDVEFLIRRFSAPTDL